MHAAVYSRYLKADDIPYVQVLFDALNEKVISASVYEPYLNELKNSIRFKQKPYSFNGYEDLVAMKADMLITLGGDGTILTASTIVRDTNVPVVGINLGRLGFLATIGKSNIRQAIGLIAKGEFTLCTRNTLKLDSKPGLFGATPFALNDFAVLKKDNSSMIIIHVHIDGEYLNSYWADGIILATATGSTGYSLSCGGPIVYPNSCSFVLTPVAPHNLNVRPLVISDNSKVSFKVEGRANNFLCTMDSRQEIITDKHEITLSKGSFSINMVQVHDISFLRTLRNKLSWGTDMRNH